jgi:ssDNA-binding Zn-finger/Zn-ribbon topoisomerase 1
MAIQYIRITRTIPICNHCNKPMVRYSGGPGRTRYYKCSTKDCGQTGTGLTTRERL